MSRGDSVISSVASAISEQDNLFGGFLSTSLTSPLSVLDGAGAEVTEIKVVSTESFPLKTTIDVDQERIEVTVKDDTTFTITSRPDAPVDGKIHAVGTELSDVGRVYSDLDAARRMLLLRYSTGSYLEAIGDNYGLTRPLTRGVGLSLDDASYRLYIQKLNALAAGPMQAVTVGLSVVLDPTVATATTSSANPVRLDFGSAVLPLGMQRWLVEIDDIYYRIAQIDSGRTWIDLLPHSGQIWSAANFSDGTVTVNLIPWDVWEEANKPGNFFVSFALTRSGSPFGATYLQGGEVAISTTSTSVTVDYDVKHVLGVWLASDTERTGTNYYGSGSSFAGKVLTLAPTPLPGANTAVIVDYGAIDPGTAQLLADINTRNVPDPSYAVGPSTEPDTTVTVGGVTESSGEYWPAYLWGYETLLRDSILEIVRAAGMLPIIEAHSWRFS